MKAERIKELRNVLATATGGKWSVLPKPNSRFVNIKTDKSKWFIAEEMILPVADAIVKSHEIIPDLLTALESAQSENERLKAALWAAVNQMNSDPLNANGEWETGMFCGLEDVDITDRYMACRYGYDRALEKVQEWIIDGLVEALKPGEPKRKPVDESCLPCMYLGGECCGMFYWHNDGRVLCNECGREAEMELLTTGDKPE